MTNKAIAIIGCGIAGISSVIELAEKGKDVIIFEARPHIGGRFFSFFDASTNEYIDNGQHVMAGAYDNFLSILRELGSLDNIYKQKSLFVPFYSADGRKDSLDTSFYNGKFGLLDGLLKMKHISIASKSKILMFFAKLQFNFIKYSDLSAHELLKNEAQGDDALYWFWEPLITATLNLPSKVASAELLVQVLKNAFFGSKGKSSLIYSTIPFSYLLLPFVDWANKKRVKLILNQRVRNISIENNRAKSINCNSEEIEVAAIISTVQPYELMKLISSNRNDYLSSFLNKFEYSSIISIYYWLDRSIIEEDFIALLGTIPQWIFNSSRIEKKANAQSSKSNGEKITVTISNANEIWSLTNQNIVELCWNDIVKVIPDAKKASIIKSKVLRERYATIKANSEFIKLRKEIKAKQIENLYFAGDWIDTKLPATLESAAISGKIAAQYILNKF